MTSTERSQKTREKQKTEALVKAQQEEQQRTEQNSFYQRRKELKKQEEIKKQEVVCCNPPHVSCAYDILKSSVGIGGVPKVAPLGKKVLCIQDSNRNNTCVYVYFVTNTLDQTFDDPNNEMTEVWEPLDGPAAFGFEFQLCMEFDIVEESDEPTIVYIVGERKNAVMVVGSNFVEMVLSAMPNLETVTVYPLDNATVMDLYIEPQGLKSLPDSLKKLSFKNMNLDCNQLAELSKFKAHLIFNECTFANDAACLFSNSDSSLSLTFIAPYLPPLASILHGMHLGALQKLEFTKVGGGAFELGGSDMYAALKEMCLLSFQLGTFEWTRNQKNSTSIKNEILESCADTTEVKSPQEKNEASVAIPDILVESVPDGHPQLVSGSQHTSPKASSTPPPIRTESKDLAGATGGTGLIGTEPSKNVCMGIRRDGQSCTKHPLRNSNYCHHHQPK